MDEFLQEGDSVLVFRLQLAAVRSQSLDFTGDFGDLFLQTGDLQLEVLKGDQVPKIGIHLFAPSHLLFAEEDRTCS